MKPFLYWLLGEKAGRIVVGSWAWLLGQSIDAGDARTVAIAQQSVDDVAENVDQLTAAVAQQHSALQQAQKLLITMQSQAESLNQQAMKLVQHGDDHAALSILGELDIIEASIPQLEVQVNTAQRNFEAGREQLREQQRQLQQMKTQQKVSASLQKVTAALEKANALSGLSSDRAIQTFETARDAIDRKSIEATSHMELQSLGREVQRKTNQLNAADRLAALKHQINAQELPDRSSDAH
ncbi:MAG: PspA/IM30 family protein [Cyanobacteria bacterium J06633_2]